MRKRTLSHYSCDIFKISRQKQRPTRRILATLCTYAGHKWSSDKDINYADNIRIPLSYRFARSDRFFFGNVHIRLLLRAHMQASNLAHNNMSHNNPDANRQKLVHHSVVKVTTVILQMLCCYWLLGSVMCRCFEISSNTSETVTLVRKHVSVS